MKTTIALYEALIQANIPASAARQVADTLEQDMTSVLATKQDLQQLELATRQDLQRLEQVMNLRFEAVDQLMAARFEAVDQRFVTLEKNLESRIVVKLGALMVTLFGLTLTALKLLN